MQGGVNELDCWDFELGMDVDRNATPLIFDLNRSVFEHRDGDFVSESVDGFVDRVIDYFPNQMVKASKVCAADVHARAFSDAFEFA